MNKTQKIILALIVLVLLLGGGYYLYMQKMAPVAKVAQTATKQTQSTVFGSIQEALSKSISLECKFTDESNRQTTAYVKAGAIRADVVSPDKTQQYGNASIILKDNKLYVWDTIKKQGMTMAFNPADFKNMMPAPSGSMKEGSTQPSAEKPGDIMAMLEKYKNDCKPAVIADSLFVVPTDVTFQDLSKMMPSGVPSIPAPSGMSQQDIQKMMQQYQNQTPQTQGQ